MMSFTCLHPRTWPRGSVEEILPADSVKRQLCASHDDTSAMMLERIWRASLASWSKGTPLQTLWTSGSCRTTQSTLRRHSWSKGADSRHRRRFSSPTSCGFMRVRQNCNWSGLVHLRQTVWHRVLPQRHLLSSVRMMAGSAADSVAPNGSPNSLMISVTKFDKDGNWSSRVIRKSELSLEYGIQARDIRFSALSSLFVRADSIILRLQHIKAIINTDSFVLLDSDHPAIQEFIPQLQERLRVREIESLPFEFRALEAMLMKFFTVLDERYQDLAPALRDVLNSLLDPRLFSVDRGELHVLLHHSKSMSEFHSIVRDIEATLTDMLDNEHDMADMYLTHWATTRKERDLDDIEEINSILEAYLMQAEKFMSEIQKLRELIDQSESIILINLDSQRNVMLRLGLQLEMGMFSAAISGLIGVAFGMNLDSSLEENPFAFWVVTGMMITGCGLLWRRLLTFLGKNLDKPSLKRLTKPRTKK